MASVLLNNTSNTTNALVTVQANQGCIVQGIVVMAGGTVNITFGYIDNSNTFTAGTGPMPFTAQAGFSSGFFPEGLYKCPVNTVPALTMNTSVQTSGVLVYQQGKVYG
jgi:hypothetical protein